MVGGFGWRAKWARAVRSSSRFLSPELQAPTVPISPRTLAPRRDRPLRTSAARFTQRVGGPRNARPSRPKIVLCDIGLPVVDDYAVARDAPTPTSMALHSSHGPVIRRLRT